METLRADGLDQTHIGVRLEDGVIRYVAPARQVDWKIPLRDVVLISEWTDDRGPLADYYLDLVTGSGYVAETGLPYYDLLMYADGMDEFLRRLESALGTKLSWQLGGSTRDDSNIVWPPSMAGQKLFDMRPARPRHLWGKLLQKIFPQYLLTFTPAVQSLLRQNREANQVPDRRPT